MRKTIVGIPLCEKCNTLKTQNPDAEYVQIQPVDILPLARATNIKEMPFIIISGNLNELDKELNHAE